MTIERLLGVAAFLLALCLAVIGWQIQYTVEDINGDVKSVDQRVDNLNTKIDAGLDKVGDKIDDLQKTVSDNHVELIKEVRAAKQ